ncbi:ester cyclase [Mycobacterium sp. GA-2829]|uniref:ester cyclase n=1 Tax=Mycobacterium sp. GA-2829 TaxID=1772283 RepID=UPI00073FB89D|nr:nuclear transport factor 2 family protein [Mycobacterium sp. GA-2829]KUI39120.1 polyketide cyclase [Mycobacterium sp. GA-2829]
MTTYQQLYEQWINRLWSGEPVAAELVSDDFLGHWPDREVHGPGELQAIIDQTHAMLSDLTFQITVGPIVDGDLLAGRWEGRGTSVEGEVRFTGNDILRVADGKFTEYWTGTSMG